MLYTKKDSPLCYVKRWKKMSNWLHLERVWLEECCHYPESDLMDDEKSRNNLGIEQTEDRIINCHRPDDMRLYIVRMSQILSIIFTLFSPLLLTLIPNNPWRHRQLLKIDSLKDRNNIQQKQYVLEPIQNDTW